MDDGHRVNTIAHFERANVRQILYLTLSRMQIIGNYWAQNRLDKYFAIFTVTTNVLSDHATVCNVRLFCRFQLIGNSWSKFLVNFF